MQASLVFSAFVPELSEGLPADVRQGMHYQILEISYAEIRLEPEFLIPAEGATPVLHSRGRPLHG